jgi:hypothetical protein
MRGTYELRRLENVLTAGQWPEGDEVCLMGEESCIEF